MTPIRTKFMSVPFVPALVALFHNVWPVATGATFGEVIAEAEKWRYPWLAAIVTGALVQIMIALLRAWFTERRDLLNTMKAMLGEQRETYLTFINAEKEERHAVANRAHKAELKAHMLAAGVPVDELPRQVTNIYPEKKDRQT